MTDRPVPKPPRLVTVEPLPQHVQFCVVGRPMHAARRNNLLADPTRNSPPVPLQLLGWLRESDDPERLLDQFRERNTDVHFERRTSTHERCTPDDVTAERDTTLSVRDHFRPRDYREARRGKRGDQ